MTSLEDLILPIIQFSSILVGCYVEESWAGPAQYVRWLAWQNLISLKNYIRCILHNQHIIKGTHTF